MVTGLFSHNYYYIVTKHEGNLIVLGPYNSQREAQQKGFEKLNGILFDIKTYPTRDLNRATRAAKYGSWDNSGDMGDLTNRAKH